MPPDPSESTGNQHDEPQIQATKAPQDAPAPVRHRVLLETAGGPNAIRVTWHGNRDDARIVIERQDLDALGTPVWTFACDFRRENTVYNAIVHLATARAEERQWMQDVVRVALHTSRGMLRDLVVAGEALLKVVSVSPELHGTALEAANKAMQEATNLIDTHRKLAAGLQCLILGDEAITPQSPEVIARTLRDGNLRGTISSRWSFVGASGGRRAVAMDVDGGDE